MKRMLEKYLQPLREGEGAGGGGGDASGSVVTGGAPAGSPPPADGGNPPPADDPPAQPPAGDPPAPPPASEAAPLTREALTLPEGVNFDEAQMNDALALLNNSELPAAERASKLMELHAKALEAHTNKLAEDWIAEQKKSADAIRSDPDIGGANLPASEALFAKVLSEFGDDELTQDIVSSGLGNKLSFARFLVKIGKITGEGKPLVGEPTSSESLSRAQKLYPNQGKV